ncbi:hypothetical protein FRC02_008781 [Tulasnella sp. 418]|nr:hypothetical protein FRC02_008781 [Tulasnella sp. 418]
MVYKYQYLQSLVSITHRLFLAQSSFHILIMKLSFAFLLTFLLGCVWTVSAASVVKRDTIQSILTDLASTLEPHESSLKSALTGVDKNDTAAVLAAVSPDLTAIDLALKEAGVKINALGGVSKRQDDTEAIAQQIAEIITNLLEAFQGIEDLIEEFPILGGILGPILSPIDEDLAIILVGLGILLSGVLKLVADLLRGLADALTGLGGASSGVLGF